MVDNKKAVRSNRRAFLKSVGAGATALSFSAHSVAAQSSGGEVEYVSRIKRELNDDGEFEEEPIYTTIDSNRYARIKAVENAAENIEKKVDQRFGPSNDVKVVVKTLDSGKTSAERGISVQARTWVLHDSKKRGKREVPPTVSVESLERNLPGKVNGQATMSDGTRVSKSVPVEFEHKTIEQTASFNNQYRPIPGGCQITHYDGLYTWDDKEATTGCRAYDKVNDDNNVMMTAGHAMDESDGGIRQPDTTGVGSPGRFKNIQDQGSDDYDFDAGFFTLDSGVDTTDKLAQSSGTTSAGVDGTHTWEWIKTEGPTTTIDKKGRTTGNTSGHVDSYSDNDRQFFITANQEGGDSGGPMYTTNSDGHYLAGLAVWAGGGNGGGNAAPYIENELDIYFY